MENTYNKLDYNELTFSILQAKNFDELQDIISKIETSSIIDALCNVHLKAMLHSKLLTEISNDLDTQKVSLLKVINMFKNY